jgi:hypothetical protein
LRGPGRVCRRLWSVRNSAQAGCGRRTRLPWKWKLLTRIGFVRGRDRSGTAGLRFRRYATGRWPGARRRGRRRIGRLALRAARHGHPDGTYTHQQYCSEMSPARHLYPV